MTSPSDQERAFTEYLAGLVTRDDRAALAALRRGLGKRPGEAAEMFPLVVPWLPSTASSYRQDDYFLVAALFAAHQKSWSPADGVPSNLGASFRKLADSVASESIEKRFVALLNSEREDLPEHLRYAISLLATHDVPVDWSQLLRDLGGWGWESRSVQRAWAQAFWRR
jgi:CRISPR system Cascade subunit CasB